MMVGVRRHQDFVPGRIFRLVDERGINIAKLPAWFVDGAVLRWRC